MRPHRAARTTVAVTALASALLLSPALPPGPSPAAAAPAAAGPVVRADSTPGYSVRALTVRVRVGPRGDQPCTVDADLYLPDGASRRRKVPAILTTNGFGGDKADDNQSAVGRGFARAGYAVLSYSGLGFGRTTCQITLDDPQWDGKAGKQLVDVLAGTRAWTSPGSTTKRYLRMIAQERRGDPRVGMVGGSYGGQVQYAVAQQDPRVDALIPIITWNDLTYSLAPGRVAKREWVDLFFGAGISSGAQNATADPATIADGCPNFTDQACVGVTSLNALGYPDPGTVALARHASVASYVAKVRAPTLVVQGQKDTLFNLNEAVATYRALQRQGTPTKLVFQSWGHSGSTPAPGELDFGAGSLRDSYLGRRFLDWMDHHVRGTTAPTGPEFSWFRDWVRYDTSPATAGRAVARAYATSSRLRWDPTSTLYLSADGTAQPSKVGVVAGAQAYANAGPAPTSYSETSGLEGEQVDLPPTDAPGTATFFTTAPLDRAADLVGSPSVRLRLDAPAARLTQAGGPSGQLVLFAKLYDVAPDGSKVLKNRLVAPLRVADVTRPVTLRLPGIVHRFAAGHRVQLAVAASDAAYAGNTAPQPVRVLTSPGDPSTLGLPLTTRLELRQP